jgi:hypothetical protein
VPSPALALSSPTRMLHAALGSARALAPKLMPAAIAGMP